MILILSSPSKAKAKLVFLDYTHIFNHVTNIKNQVMSSTRFIRLKNSHLTSMTRWSNQTYNSPYLFLFPFSLIHHLPTFHHSSTEDSTFSFVFTISTFSIFYNSSSTHSHAVRKKTNTLKRYTHPFQNYTSN